MPDDFYDERTSAVLDSWNRPRRPVPAEVAHGWRAGVGVTALLAGAALGVQDVLAPKQETPVIEEIDLDALGPGEHAPVVYLHVPGAPRASRALVRPWLF